MMQFSYQKEGGGGVPSPSDHTGSMWWLLHGCQQAKEFAEIGVTDLLFPPVIQGGSLGMGYDPFDHYDIGNPFPTRFGTREMLQQFAAMLKANGIRIHNDNVLAHMDGGSDSGYDYSYTSVGGKGLGRFPKDKTCFVGPGVPKDNVAAPATDFAYLFGRQISYFSGYFGDGRGDNRRGYMLRNMLEALGWLYRALDLDGCRLDNVKSLDPSWVRTILTTSPMKGTFSVGEFYDGSISTLNWWVFNSGVSGLSSVFDYNLYFQLRSMCMNNSSWDMRQLVGAGFCNQAEYNAVTFAENFDTDVGGSPIIYNKIQAYAVIMSFPGTPIIYYKDWSTDEGCYGLKTEINNLVWIRNILAGGAITWRFADYQAIVYERLGYNEQPGVLVGINNDQYGGWREINVQTHWTPNALLHDYSGHANDVWTDWESKVTISIPPNSNGQGYVMYAPAGYEGKTIPQNSWTTTQVFEGALDLDIPPAKAGATSDVMKIFVKAHTKPEFHFENTEEERDGLTAILLDTTGVKVSGSVPKSDMYQVSVVSTKTIDQPFRLAVTYQASQELSAPIVPVPLDEHSGGHKIRPLADYEVAMRISHQ